MQREYFTNYQELRQYLLDGGKINKDGWTAEGYIHLDDNLSVVDELGIGGWEDLNFKEEFDLYYKWKSQPKTIGIEEVADYLERGAHLRHESWDEGEISVPYANSPARMVGSYKAYYLWPNFLKGNWIVIKEPTK